MHLTRSITEGYPGQERRLCLSDWLVVQWSWGGDGMLGSGPVDGRGFVPHLCRFFRQMAVACCIWIKRVL